MVLEDTFYHTLKLYKHESKFSLFLRRTNTKIHRCQETEFKEGRKDKYSMNNQINNRSKTTG